MSICPVCKKEYQNLKTHLTRQAKNDDLHKKYFDSLDNLDVDPKPNSIKKFQKDSIVRLSKNSPFKVIEDLGKKIVVGFPGSDLVKLTMKKERF